MAQRRMLSRAVVGGDAFLELGFEARALYLHLVTEADDDGLVENIKRQLRVAGTKASALEELTSAGFTIVFDSGICAISHWHVHNRVRRDRYRPTVHTEELGSLYINDAGVYRMVESRHPSVGPPEKKRRSEVEGEAESEAESEADSRAEAADFEANFEAEAADSRAEAADFGAEAAAKPVTEGVKSAPDGGADSGDLPRELFLPQLVTRKVTKEKARARDIRIAAGDNLRSAIDSGGESGVAVSAGGEGTPSAASGAVKIAGGHSPSGKGEKPYYLDTLPECEVADYLAFCKEVCRYFKERRYCSSPHGFITYNEQRGWLGLGGEGVREDFEKYADMWEDRELIKRGMSPSHYYEVV